MLVSVRGYVHECRCLERPEEGAGFPGAGDPGSWFELQATDAGQ